MSYSKRARMGLAMGVFLFLSFVVFGTIFYVAYSANSVVVLASGADDGIGNEGLRFEDYRNSVAADPNPRIRRGPIEILPACDPNLGFRRGPIEILPQWAPIKNLPDYNPFLGIRRPPVLILPI